ncbi:MAG: type II toxin-antitoxin system RelE/ParE family toxin [Pseudomonadota bacterium]|nr:type II toxin-antitoxin system RelE/ParE family toxin [Pseudomonadota bacterium]
MIWAVLFHDEFALEFEQWVPALQDELLAHALLLRQYGPHLGRPTVDTLNGSRHANMKELRFNWNGGIWRIAFAFDPDRQGILLAAGNKAGVNQKRFYSKLIELADQRYEAHLTD